MIDVEQESLITFLAPYLVRPRLDLDLSIVISVDTRTRGRDRQLHSYQSREKLVLIYFI